MRVDKHEDSGVLIRMRVDKHEDSKTIAEARRLFRASRGMLRAGNALKVGVHPRTLYELRDAGRVEQLSRGLYEVADAPPLGNPDRVTVALKIVPALEIPIVSSTMGNWIVKGMLRDTPFALFATKKVSPKVSPTGKRNRAAKAALS